MTATAHDGLKVEPAPVALAVSNLRAGYGTAEVLHDVSLAVPAGQVLALLGPNGAGKSTLLRTICGLIRPMSGQVMLRGEDITKSTPHSRSAHGLCQIPEGRGIFPSLTVRENLRLLSPPRGGSGELEQVFSMFPNLKRRLGQAAGSLSGGEQQMLAVSRAIVARPTVVLFDEVSLGLAPIVVDRIYEAVRSIIATGSAVLLVEQYVDRALDLASSAVVLDRGTVAFRGPIAELRAADLLETYLGSGASGQVT
jgi:branched-chain amino acid transport system ATP-binding protein